MIKGLVSDRPMQQYVAPLAEIFEFNAVRTIMDASPLGRDGDNEHTGEEELF